MENAIAILKRSIENLKSEALRLGERLKNINDEKANVENEINLLVSRVRELEEAIKQLEGTKHASTSKNKKTK